MRLTRNCLGNIGKMLDFYSQFNPSPLSIKQFIDFGESPASPRFRPHPARLGISFRGFSNTLAFRRRSRRHDNARRCTTLVDAIETARRRNSSGSDARSIMIPFSERLRSSSKGEQFVDPRIPEAAAPGTGMRRAFARSGFHCAIITRSSKRFEERVAALGAFFREILD